MTGTPLDLTPFGPLLSALGFLYWLLAVALAAFALWHPSRWLFKLPLAALVLAAFIYPVVRHASFQQAQRDESKARRDTATALFAERCKTAGEEISRTVKDVDGILLKIRPQMITDLDQFRLDDPYGRNCDGDACVALYLFDYRMIPARSGSGSGLVPYTPRLYHYVDVDDPASGERVRYTKETANAPIKKSRSSAVAPRYGIEWEDISLKEDREHWIAGGSIKVVDLVTKEVIAERRGYLMDPGQGSIAGGRNPWAWARSYTKGCPSVADHNQVFVLKVLEPKKGE